MTRLFFILLMIAGAANATAPTKRILLIGNQPDHPPGSHEYLPTCRLLAACLNRVEGVEATVSDGWPEAEVTDAAAIVLYRAPFATQMFEGPRSPEIRGLLDRGAGLVTIHWATGIPAERYDRLKEVMTSYQGGSWQSHSRQVVFGESPLVALQPTHEILRGVALPSVRDEWYLGPELGPGARPLWSVMARDEELTVGWTYERPGGGRCFATTLGHFWGNFAREPFRRAITNGILWAAGVAVPEEGAAVDLEATLLRPPQEAADAIDTTAP